MKISIVVPAYNAEKTIERCVRSILCQSGPEVELIVVDDGSADCTRGILDNLSNEDARLVVTSQPNRGRCSARNTGIAMATGEWIGFCDADDLMRNDALQRMAKLASPEVCSVWAGYSRAMDSNQSGVMTCLLNRRDLMRTIASGDRKVVHSGGAELTFDGTLERVVWSKLYRCDVLAKEDSPRFREGVRYGEDALFNLEYLSRADGAVAFTSEESYFYDDAKSMTCKCFDDRDVAALEPFYAAAWDVFKNVGNLPENGIQFEQVDSFIGNEIVSLITKAALFSDDFDQAVCSLECLLREEKIVKAWRAARIKKCDAILRDLQIALAKRGHVGTAIRMQFLRIKSASLIKGLIHRA